MGMNYLFVGFFFMLLPLCFGHTLAALPALVVIPCASDLVEPELGGFHLRVADVTGLHFNRLLSRLNH